MSGILIMGGSTFVSRCLAEHLIQQGYEVDILTRGLSNIQYSGFKDHLVCDRRSFSELQKTLNDKQYEYVFDISAYTKNDVSLLMSSLNTSALKKYIFCSTAAVYKPADRLRAESDERGENPDWGQYGIDKKEAEDYLFYQYQHQGFPILIFRPTYIYGENNNLYRESYFFDRIRNNKTIPVPHGHHTRVQFLHIADLCKVFESAMTVDVVGKAYNVTHPEVISWEYLIECCSNAIGTSTKVQPVDYQAMNVEPRSFFPFRDVALEVNTTRLQNDGFHVPSIRLNEGIRRTYEWYLTQKPQLSDNRMNRVDEI